LKTPVSSENHTLMKRMLSSIPAGNALTNPLAWVCAVTTVALLVACGGGDGAGGGGTFSLPTDDLLGAPCSSCAPGVLVGLAATGAPLANAQVRVVASNGMVVRGQTGADGGFTVPTDGLAGAMLLQVSGTVSGSPVVLHSLALAADIGNRLVNVTPLTELMTAFSLGGMPQDLLDAGQIDFARVSATSLRSQQSRVRAMVRPVLSLSGAENADLRTGMFATDRTGLDAALELIELTRVIAGYELRAVPLTQTMIRLDPAASSATDSFPAMTSAERDAATASLTALAAIAQQLDQLTTLFATAIPAANTLQTLFATGFYHTGLDAQGFADRVLRRVDATPSGGFSLRSARFHAPRVLRTDGPDRLLVRFQVSPAGPWLAYAEEMWMVRSGTSWLWQGDGKAALVQVRNLAVLGARALEDSEVRALPNMQCAQVNGIERCRIEGPQTTVPPGGYLDFGSPQEAQFGHFAFFRARTGGPLDRLGASRAHSRLIGLPSAQVTRHLAFEIDSRRIDPSVRKVRVSGLGLPAQGLVFVAPTQLPGSSSYSHWTQEDRPAHNWQAVEIGRCIAIPDAPAQSCIAQWAPLGAGQTYQFELLDMTGSVVQTLTARLFDRPKPAAEILAQRSAVFARFDLVGQDSAQPQYARLLNPDALASGAELSNTWSWRRPADQRMRVLTSTLEVQLAELASGAIKMREAHLLPEATGAPNASALWASMLAVPPGSLPVWLTARLVAADELGNLYVHYLSPANPY
jgi:hypothetical protein